VSLMQVLFIGQVVHTEDFAMNSKGPIFRQAKPFTSLPFYNFEKHFLIFQNANLHWRGARL